MKYLFVLLFISGCLSSPTATNTSEHNLSGVWGQLMLIQTGDSFTARTGDVSAGKFVDSITQSGRIVHDSVFIRQLNYRLGDSGIDTFNIRGALTSAFGKNDALISGVYLDSNGQVIQGELYTLYRKF